MEMRELRDAVQESFTCEVLWLTFGLGGLRSGSLRGLTCQVCELTRGDPKKDVQGQGPKDVMSAHDGEQNPALRSVQ